MTTELLHRIQFGLTVSFHFIFPPMSLGLGLILVIFGVKSVRTNDPKWRQLSMFWVKIYGLIFAMGIATGIVQEFEFGTNWSVYSRFVGNIFGSLLAAEGIFAFMLEGGFLGLMLFGGSRLGNKMWLFATTMVVVGATFSATWIVMANSWMQTPRRLRDQGRRPGRPGLHDQLPGRRVHPLVRPAHHPPRRRVVDGRHLAGDERRRLLPAAEAPRRSGQDDDPGRPPDLHGARRSPGLRVRRQPGHRGRQPAARQAGGDGGACTSRPSCAPMFILGSDRSRDPDDHRASRSRAC